MCIRDSGKGGDTLGDIFVGTSPGFKRSHVRKHGADEVYSVAINTFDLPVTASDWLDKTLLQVDNVVSVTIAGKSIDKQKEKWVFDGNENTDQEKVDEMIKVFEALRVTGISTLGSENLDFDTVVLKSGDAEYEYQFASNDDDYLVVRKDIDAVFSIASANYDKVIGVEWIIPEAEAPGEEVTPKPDTPQTDAPQSNSETPPKPVGEPESDQPKETTADQPVEDKAE